MRSGHCWESAGRRWLRRMTGCTPVHGNIQNAAAKAWRAVSELGYRQDCHQIWGSWVPTGEAWFHRFQLFYRYWNDIEALRWRGRRKFRYTGFDVDRAISRRV